MEPGVIFAWFLALATSYAQQRSSMIPVYIYFKCSEFQRIGEFGLGCREL